MTNPTRESMSWMQEPWTCPRCGSSIKAGGKGPHLRFCDPYLCVELFNDKVQRGANDDYWPFMGARVPAGGYGRFILFKKLMAAHRAAYILAYGNIPAGLDVMHLCDNPPCCNPRHLKAATTLENMRDAKAKGRMRHKYSPIDQLIHPHLSRRLHRG